jgi:lipopolysaccharide biosynthesis glycosyltransferase
MSEPVFREYVTKYVGLEAPEKYFNSGVLVMNLESIRTEKIQERFLHLLCKYNFKTVAPDQDYLNFLCSGKVKYLECGWNKHAIDENVIDRSELYLMHYNMFNKPWRYDNVQNEDLFWKFAKYTDFEEVLLSEKRNYSDEMKRADREAGVALVESAKELANSKNETTFAKIKNEIQKSDQIKKQSMEKESKVTSKTKFVQKNKLFTKMARTVK